MVSDLYYPISRGINPISDITGRIASNIIEHAGWYKIFVLDDISIYPDLHSREIWGI